MTLTPDYAPFYCEENIHRLDRSDALKQFTRHAVFISNAERTCALWHQNRSPDLESPVLWDYHVVLVARREGLAQIWDLDTRLGAPVPALRWLEATFPLAGTLFPRYEPRFHVIASSRFQAMFSSDRSHMRDDSGTFREPPPDWPAPYDEGLGMNLDSFIEGVDSDLGSVMDFNAFRAFLTTEVVPA